MRTAFRASVMLIALVILPAAWIHYGPLPPGAQQVVNRTMQAARASLGIAPADSKKPIAADAVDLSKTSALRNDAEVEFFAKPKSFGTAPTSRPTEPSAESSSSPLAQRAEPLLADLRKHGVVEYVLEPWGSSGRLYRFHCNMPLVGSSDQTRRFESVSESPLGSIERVAAEVSAWRAERTLAARIQ